MSVQVLEKAMKIMDLLLAKKASMTLTQISVETGFPKSTVHAILSTLREYNVIEQLADGRYVLGIHLYELGCAAASSWDISSLVHSYLEELSEATGATAFISVLDRGQAMTFDHVSGSFGLQIVSDLGSRLPLNATSQGKVLLSGMTEKEIVTYTKKNVLNQYTPHTIVDSQKLVEEISKVREAGYAVEDGEYRIGLRSVSCPVFDSKSRIRYALGTIGLFRKTTTEDFVNAIEKTQYYSALISKELSKKIVS